LLTTNINIKKATSLIKSFNLDINDFPDVKERLMKVAMRFYLGRYFYKNSSHEDYMDLHRVEDLLLGYLPMLGYLVEDLVAKNKMNEAKGLMVRHNL
jgi:hypothetical protein